MKSGLLRIGLSSGPRPNAVLARPIQAFRALTIAGSLIAAPQIALAGSDIRVSADVVPTIGYSNNPFGGISSAQGTVSTEGSVYAKIDVVPEVRVIAAHSVLTVTGDIDFEHYFQHYPNTDNYKAAVDYSAQPNARLTTNVRASYTSAIVGGFGLLNTVIDPTQPAPPPVTGIDLALFGTRARRRQLDFAGDAGYTLSARSSVTVNAFYDVSRYDSITPRSNYDSYGGGAGYSRRISDRLQFGGQASVSRSVYQGLFGNSEVYSLQATFGYKFNAEWNLGGAFGASYAKRAIGGNKISPTGNLQLCRVGPRSTLCATVSEAVQATGFTGTVVSQTVGAAYSYQLSKLSSISLSGDYTHHERPVATIAGTNIYFANSYFTTSATYSRTLRERLSFLVTGRYRAITGGIGNRPADFGGTVGFAIKLGNYK